MTPIRQFRPFAFCALLVPLVLGGPMQDDAAAQIVLKQTSTNFAPRISERDIQRMREEDRIRQQRIRERQAAGRRFAAENRRILQQQRTGRSILFGAGRSNSRSYRGGSAVQR